MRVCTFILALILAVAVCACGKSAQPAGKAITNSPTGSPWPTPTATWTPGPGGARWSGTWYARSVQGKPQGPLMLHVPMIEICGVGMALKPSGLALFKNNLTIHFTDGEVEAGSLALIGRYSGQPAALLLVAESSHTAIGELECRRGQILYTFAR
jgi:hypothetical protein